MTERIAGVVWEIDLEHRVIYCEGRLACIVDDDRAARGLRSVAVLPYAAWFAEFCMLQLGLELDGRDARVRRIDIAGDLRCADAQVGRDLLNILARSAGCPDVRAVGEVVRSISWSRAGRVQFRVYDRGVLAESHDPGALIRMERQLSFSKARQPPVGELLDRDLGREWASELERHCAEVPPLGSRQDAERILFEQMARGGLTRESGTRLLGNIARLEFGGYAAWPPTKAGQQARARVVRVLAKHGVATIVPARRRKEPWQTRAHCRPVGRVVTVDDAVWLVRSALQGVARSGQQASRA